MQHTYEAALKAKKPTGVCVAADHEEIAAEVRLFGGQVFMTSPACASGTDRLAEVAPRLAGVDLLVNVQGDEPELSGEAIDQVIELLEQNKEAAIATLATPIRDRSKLLDPACVKVVFDSAGRALYFSRAPIPHAREWRDELLTSEQPLFYQHLGLYAYRRDFLTQFARWQRTSLEKLENLEQLRCLNTAEPSSSAWSMSQRLGSIRRTTIANLFVGWQRDETDKRYSASWASGVATCVRQHSPAANNLVPPSIGWPRSSIHMQLLQAPQCAGKGRSFATPQ